MARSPWPHMTVTGCSGTASVCLMRSPSSTWMALGRCPVAYSESWRTSSTAASSGVRVGWVVMVGAGAVDLGQPLEVARLGAEARGERGGEAVRVGCAQQRVAGLLPADGAGAGGAGWGGAERSGAVGGPHR